MANVTLFPPKVCFRFGLDPPQRCITWPPQRYQLEALVRALQLSFCLTSFKPAPVDVSKLSEEERKFYEKFGKLPKPKASPLAVRSLFSCCA